MHVKEISTAAAPAPTGAYSQALRVGDLIITGGQVGSDPVTAEFPETVQDQVRQAIRNLEAVLEAAGVGLRQVVKTNCFLAHADDFSEFDKVYREFFSEPFPARSTVGVSFPRTDLLFEIEAWATPSED